MCEIVGARQGWAAALRLAALYLLPGPALNRSQHKGGSYVHAATEDKSGVMMIDLSVIMMTLVVMKSGKSTMAVITSAAPERSGFN